MDNGMGMGRHVWGCAAVDEGMGEASDGQRCKEGIAEGANRVQACVGMHSHGLTGTRGK